MNTLPLPSRPLRGLPWLTGAAGVAALSVLAAFGPLSPPAGAISSTAKPLSEVEPRTAVNAANTPGGAAAVFTISQSGSYYLTGNVTGVASKDGIRITAANVTLDLNGFAVTGVPSASSGIAMTATAARTVVKNGSVTSWPLDGIDGGFNTHGRYERLIAQGNGAFTTGRFGIRAGGAAVLEDCDASNNTGGGISCNDACTLSACIATGNTDTGFVFGAACVLRGCAAQSNTVNGYSGASGSTLDHCSAAGPAGGSSKGFNLTTRCRVTDCTATGYATGISVQGRNVLTGCSASGNSGIGISADDDCEVTGCTASGNTGVGISAASGVLISHCAANGNGGDNIAAVQRCNLVDCIANGSTGGNGINLTFVTNTATNCTANGNFLNGIYAQQRCRLADCICRDNQQNGVRINFLGAISGSYCAGNQVCGILSDGGGGTEFRNNTCSENGNATTLGAGIRVATGACRVDGNTLAGNYRNMDITGTGNLVAHNSSCVAGAGGHYTIVANNSYGPLVNVTAVGDITGTASANHPMANYVH
jgi:hypothetical protein